MLAKLNKPKRLRRERKIDTCGDFSTSIFLVLLTFITARKRSLRRLCFYRCLSVHRGEGGSASQDALQAPPPGMENPPRWRTPPVNVQAVRILLECILVESLSINIKCMGAHGNTVFSHFVSFS